MKLIYLSRIAVFGITVLLVSGIWQGLSSQLQQTPACEGLLGRPLRVGVVSWPGYASGISANHGFKAGRDSLFFRNHDLCVAISLIESLPEGQKALEYNGVDVVWSTVDELPAFLNPRIKAKVIMQVDWSRGGDAIVASRSIKQFEGLDNKVISLVKLSPSHWLLESRMRRSGLSKEQQERIERLLDFKEATRDARAAFVSRKADAAVVWEPDVEEALEKRRADSYVLYDTSHSEAEKLIADVMVAREDFIRSHSKVIDAFVEGWLVDGTKEAQAKTSTVTRLLMENEPVFRHIGFDKTSRTIRKVKLADLTENAELFNLDQRHRQTSFNSLFDKIYNEAAETWVKHRYISSYITSAEATDLDSLRRVYERQIGPIQPPLEMSPVVVTFDVGVDVLTMHAQEVLDAKVSLLKKAIADGCDLQVEGNTDGSGGRESNQTLSLRRAQSVIRYLVSKHHLPGRQLHALGNGPDKPVAPNETFEGRGKNRRVEIRIVTQGVALEGDRDGYSR